MKKIKALLLSAGFGTRLRPLTLKTPKCLVKVNGVPLLNHWLLKLEKLGCEEVIINTHYLSHKVLEFLDLEYDKNVKNYRKTALKRAKINTPSSSQVVQPLYKSSIEKWKNYEKYFKDCHQYLEKWVAYFDYL